MQATKLADVQILADLLEQVREEVSLVCDSEGDSRSGRHCQRIQPGEVERAIAHLLQTHLEDCRFQDEIQEWLDTLRFGTSCY
jgi:hypothetical protein